MSEKKKIGVFGSAFDPPTIGHYDVLKQAAPFHDEILLIPSAKHAFLKEMQPFNCRVEMINIFVKDVLIQSCRCQVTVCRIEDYLFKNSGSGGKAVYTFDLMRALEEYYKDDSVELCFIRGSDNADPDTWQRFYKASDIEKRWLIFTATERINVRSSQVRQLIAGGDIDKESSSLKHLLLPSVFEYIRSKRLYLKEVL
ncbi:MAG: hypothetical protein QS748_02420 [Candidatus Endonucleobacter bathymodioli]|uniref:nicotinate-nucleotide adenylyltransferase n=1 Tax=Candidatus Endonucleibacter bathymodioli TaxID=539814 RepID=A0AA90NK79_9GAMM|nr:hypothetical protein [Candidatus Endonucleobacter bathymodioli]